MKLPDSGYRPFISDNATEFFEGVVRPKFRVFEYGTGESTIWFTQRVAHITTVEDDEAWQEMVFERLTELGLDHKAEAILMPWEMGPDSPRMIEEYANSINQYPDNHFDLIFCDGLAHARKLCPALAMPKTKPGGWLVIDDVGWNPVSFGTQMVRDNEWPEIRRSGPCRAAWDGQTRNTVTSFFRRPER